MTDVMVIGGGLAGSEAAWQAAEQGLSVELWEMRPEVQTPAHVTDQLAELVCSNSLGSNLVDRAPGLLKEELRHLGSVVLECADMTSVPAGGALAVDREAFAQAVTERLADHGHIAIRREEAWHIPDELVVVVATGPLTSPALAEEISGLTGADYLSFYDAMAPIVTAESVDLSIAFRASRYDKGGEGGDYLNCPMDERQYSQFVQALVEAETSPLREFEREDPRFFEACLPVEVLASRGQKALAFGPLKPVGLTDPRIGRRPHAVVQLRQDNQAATLYNLVGFQTNLRWPEQERVFRLIPGLENAEFVRFGQMHRNTFINSPALLLPTMQFRRREDLFFAGQITGTEGYVGSVASGLVAGLNAGRLVREQPLIAFPRTTMIGALGDYVCSAQPEGFQPMKANFGLFPPLEPPIRNKRARYAGYARRALRDLRRYCEDMGLPSRSQDSGSGEGEGTGVN